MRPLALAILGSFPAAFVQPRDVNPVRSGSSALSRNRRWQFKYVTGPEIGASSMAKPFEPFDHRYDE